MKTKNNGKLTKETLQRLQIHINKRTKAGEKNGRKRQAYSR